MTAVFWTLVGVLLLALPSSATARSGVDVLLTSGVRHSSNVSNAARDSDAESDQAISWGVLGSWSRPLSEDTGVDWDVGLDLTHNHEYDALDAAELHGSFNWRWRTGIAWRAPVVSLGARLSGIHHNDSRLRDGGQLQVGASLGTRLTDRLQLNGGYRWRARRAARDRVWDIEDHRVFVNLDLRTGQRITLYATLTGATGEVVSTAVPEASIVAAANAISRRPDDVFGPGVPRAGTGMGPGPAAGPGPAPSPGPAPGPGPGPAPGGGFLPGDRFAYQVDGDSLIFDTGMSIGIGQRTALDLGFGYFTTRIDDTDDYRGYSLSLTLLHRMGH